MDLLILKNSPTDVMTYWVLKDPADNPNPNVPVTEIVISFIAEQGAMSTGVKCGALASATAAHSDNKAFHCGNGLYRIDFPDAAWGTVHGKRGKLCAVAPGCKTAFMDYVIDPPVNALAVAGMESAAEAIKTVYGVDFPVNYDTARQKWNVLADVELVDGKDVVVEEGGETPTGVVDANLVQVTGSESTAAMLKQLIELVEAATARGVKFIVLGTDQT